MRARIAIDEISGSSPAFFSGIAERQGCPSYAYRSTAHAELDQPTEAGERINIIANNGGGSDYTEFYPGPKAAAGFVEL